MTLFPSGNENRVILGFPWSESRAQLLSTKPAAFAPVWSSPSDRRLDGDSRDRLYFGDNLGTLAALLRDKAVSGKVTLAYIDPPYATNSIFQSRTHRNAYTDLLIGNRYLEFLRARLVLIHELLANDGSIYVHLDDNMAFYVKILMDEIFGHRNFRNFIVRRKCSSKNYTRKTYGNVVDYILFYTKTDGYKWNRPTSTWSREHAEKEYPYVDAESGRRFKKVPVHAPGVRKGETGKPWRGVMPPPGRHWKTSPENLDRLDASGQIYWSNTGNPRKKIYLDTSKGVALNDIWLDNRDAYNQNVKVTGYPTEKNYEMMERIVSASSAPGDLVLDCFCGSGTTLAAAAALGRRWIGVDSSEDAMSASLERLLHGPQFMKVGKRPPTKAAPKNEERKVPGFSVLASERDATRLERCIKRWSSGHSVAKSPEVSLREMSPPYAIGSPGGSRIAVIKEIGRAAAYRVRARAKQRPKRKRA